MWGLEQKQRAPVTIDLLQPKTITFHGPGIFPKSGGVEAFLAARILIWRSVRSS